MTRPEPAPIPILDEEAFAADADPSVIWPALRFADDLDAEGVGIRQLLEHAELRHFRSPGSRRQRGRRRATR
jgi:hypothetical protein